MEEERYSIAQVAKLLGVHRVYVWQLVKKKKLAGKKIGNQWTVLASVLRAYMQNRKPRKA